MCDTADTTTTYRVEGMTCSHCVASVSAAVTALDGVTSAAVDLDAGTVTITSTREPDLATVAAAVHEAGYEVRP